jgi:hypothetical protein
VGSVDFVLDWIEARVMGLRMQWMLLALVALELANCAGPAEREPCEVSRISGVLLRAAYGFLGGVG